MVVGNPVDSFPFYNIVVNRKVLFDHFPDVTSACAITNRIHRRKNMIVILKWFWIVWTALPLAGARNRHCYSKWSMKRWYDVGMVVYNLLTKSARCDVQFHSGLNKKGRVIRSLLILDYVEKCTFWFTACHWSGAILTSIFDSNFSYRTSSPVKYYWSIVCMAGFSLDLHIVGARRLSNIKV
jgi:hypothetical protein